MDPTQAGQPGVRAGVDTGTIGIEGRTVIVTQIYGADARQPVTGLIADREGGGL